jgi:hypothetical protein
LCLLGGCAENSAKDYIDTNDTVAASVLVQTEAGSGNGFLIDREERLVVTSLSLVSGQDDIKVVFPILNNDGKALVRRSAWLVKAKELMRTTRANVLALDPRRDLAVLRLTNVASGSVQLKLASKTPDKGTAVRFLGGTADAGLVWTLTDCNVQSAGPKQGAEEAEKDNQGFVTVGTKLKDPYRTFEVDAPAQLAQGAVGGAVVNADNEVVGIIPQGAGQNGPVACLDQSDLRPVIASAYRTIAMEAFEKGTYDAALTFGDRALAIFPYDAMGFNERGASYALRKEYARAIEDYTRALELDPNLAMAYRNRGAAYMQIGNYQEAAADCTKAIALWPDYKKAYQTRLEAYTKLNRTKEADADAKYLKAVAKAAEAKVKWSTVSVKSSGTSASSNQSSGSRGGGGSYGGGDTVQTRDGRVYTRGRDGYYYGTDGRRYMIYYTYTYR